ncbi:MAG TPA: nitronate monooxygenase [Bryobacteraceae bacterium]|nr:nitronate monooxygenase [Bryobacteraceae bacterium]
MVSAREDGTAITRAFSGRPARGIANRVLRHYEQTGDAILPFPLQNVLTRPMRTEAMRQNRAEYLSLWAGQGVRMARRLPASELVALLKIELQTAVNAVGKLR